MIRRAVFIYEGYAEKFMHVAKIIWVLAVTLAGCAQTAIVTPYGTYRSTKDVSMTDFHLRVELGDDGQPRTIDARWGGLKGSASPVIDAQIRLLEAIPAPSVLP